MTTATEEIANASALLATVPPEERHELVAQVLARRQERLDAEARDAAAVARAANAKTAAEEAKRLAEEAKAEKEADRADAVAWEEIRARAIVDVAEAAKALVTKCVGLMHLSSPSGKRRIEPPGVIVTALAGYLNRELEFPELRGFQPASVLTQIANGGTSTHFIFDAVAYVRELEAKKKIEGGGQ